MPRNQYSEWAVASALYPGQTESGDDYFIKLLSDGLLVAVIDGLGHGKEAYRATQMAVSVLKKTSRDNSTIDIIRNCHNALMKTNGIVMSIAYLNKITKSITWSGIGNVEGILYHSAPNNQSVNNKIEKDVLLLRSGVIGYQLPPLRCATVPIKRNDILILFTDGIRSSFDKEFKIADSTNKIAAYIIKNYAKNTDDALVLVLKWIG